MEQLFLLIQQIYKDLNILSNYSPKEREELREGYFQFLVEIKDIIRALNRIIGGSTYWGWKICTVSLSLFADPERILRRFSVFAEEPRKSIITATEPCSPVFKEAQPRPSKQSISLISRIGTFMNFIYCT